MKYVAHIFSQEVASWMSGQCLICNEHLRNKTVVLYHVYTTLSEVYTPIVGRRVTVPSRFTFRKGRESITK